MTFKKVISYITLILCGACHNPKDEVPEFVFTEPPLLEQILNRGVLNISTFYNTTDYYVYRGITRGFHYDLAKDFAGFLGVKLKITEVNNEIDSAIGRLQQGHFDLLAVSMTETPERKEKMNFAQPFFHTGEVLVQNIRNNPIRNLSELDGKEIFIPKDTPYKKVLQQLQDSLHIRIYVTEVGQGSYEEILHRVETGEIHYMVIDENIARASGSFMKNLDYSLKLKDNISVSWVTRPDDDLLTQEINEWLQIVRKSGKLNYLYKRYFGNHTSESHAVSKYSVLKKGEISVYDGLLKKAAKELNWDWKLLAAIVYTESGFDPEAESEIGAYGLMQIIPETADTYNVFNYFEPDSNVYVGVQYLKYLDNYFKEQAIDSTERVKFVLASYNAGAGHILDAMRLARKYGKDPYVWDENVDFYLLNKNKPEFYRDELAKNGYCNGTQSYRYVQQVLENYHNYKNIK